MKSITKRLKSVFYLWKADRELRNAVKRADKLCEIEKTRFYVLPNIKHRLMVLRWSQIKAMRKQKFFSNEVDEKAVIKECFYYTTDKYGDTISLKDKNVKRRQWLNYIVQAKKL